MTKLRLADDLSFPADVATQVVLIAGKRGSGKTNTAKRVVEQLHHAKVPFGVLDPVDVWWGLKAGRDGMREGGLEEIYVFGGKHADYPLAPTGGSLMADLFVDYRISAVMEMVNFLYLVEDAAWGRPAAAAALREAVEILLHMLSPFAPHVSEELWERIGGKGLLCTRSWPVADADVAREETVEVVVQVNGKVRSKLTVAAGAGEGEVRGRVMDDPRIREYTAGKEIRKTVYVPGKLFSIVAS